MGLDWIAWDCIELHWVGLEAGFNQGKKTKVQLVTYHRTSPGSIYSYSLPWQYWWGWGRWQIWRGWRWRMTWRLDALGWPITPASPASSWPRYAKDLSYMPHLSFSHDIEHIPICLQSSLVARRCAIMCYISVFDHKGGLCWIGSTQSCRWWKKILYEGQFPILSLMNENTMWSTISRFNDIDPEPWLQRCWCPQG